MIEKVNKINNIDKKNNNNKNENKKQDIKSKDKTFKIMLDKEIIKLKGI